MKFILIFLNLLRIIKLCYKKVKIHLATRKIGMTNRNDPEIEKKNIKILNEKIVSVQIAIEKKKPSSESTINAEYTDKVLLYGYISVN